MKVKKEIQKAELSVTDAILRQYDSGNTLSHKILATLMGIYPTLTLHTIDNVIRVHRKKKKKGISAVRKEKKPKTAIDLAEEKILKKCRKCPFQQPGSCVLPVGLCPYPEIDDDVAALNALLKQKRDRQGEVKVKGGKILYKKPKRTTENGFARFEQSLDDDILEEQLKAEANSQYWTPGQNNSTVLNDGVIFQPDNARSPIGLEKDNPLSLKLFSRILAPGIKPGSPRDSFEQPAIDETKTKRLLTHFSSVYKKELEDTGDDELAVTDAKMEKMFENSSQEAGDENVNISWDIVDGDTESEDDDIFAPHMVYTPYAVPQVESEAVDSSDWENIINAALERTQAEASEAQTALEENDDDVVEPIRLGDFSEVLSDGLLQLIKKNSETKN